MKGDAVSSSRNLHTFGVYFLMNPCMLEQSPLLVNIILSLPFWITLVLQLLTRTLSLTEVMSSTGDKVILSEKIFKENPNYPRTALIDMLSDLLEAELVLIPWDRYEEYGHSDGMVRYIGEGRVLLNNYFDFDKYLRKRLINALTPNFDVSELHYGTFTKNSWAYINFLHVGKHVFVPMLSEKVVDFAFCQIADAFSHSQCHPIGSCEFVVAHGGVLNCTTWNVYNSTN